MPNRVKYFILSYRFILLQLGQSRAMYSQRIDF